MQKTITLLCFLSVFSLVSCSRSNWDISSLRDSTPTIQPEDGNFVDDLNRCIQQFALDTVGNLDAQERTLEVIIINDSPLNFDRPKVNVIGGLEVADSPLAIYAGGRASFAFQRVNRTENTSRNIFSIQLGWEYSEQESYPLSLDFCGSDENPLWFRTRNGDFEDLQNEYNGWDNLPSGEFDTFEGKNLKIDHQFESFLGNWPRRLRIRISQVNLPWQSMGAVTFQVPNRFVYWNISQQKFLQTTDVTVRNISWAFKKVFDDVYTLTKLGDGANQLLGLSSDGNQLGFVQDPTKKNLLTFWRIKIDEINTQQVTIQNFQTKRFITHQCNISLPLTLKAYNSSEKKKCIYFEMTAINNYIPFSAPTNRYYYLQNLANSSLQVLTSSLKHLSPPAPPTQEVFNDAQGLVSDAQLWFFHPVKWTPNLTRVEESGYIIMNKGSGQVLSLSGRILIPQAMNSTSSSDSIFRSQMWQITQDPVYSHRLKIQNMQNTTAFLTPNASTTKGLGWNITFLSNEQIVAGLTPLVGFRSYEYGVPFSNSPFVGGYLARIYPTDMNFADTGDNICVQKTKQGGVWFGWKFEPTGSGTYRLWSFHGNYLTYTKKANDDRTIWAFPDRNPQDSKSEWRVELASQFGNIGYRLTNVFTDLVLTAAPKLDDGLSLSVKTLNVDDYTQVFRFIDLE